MNYLTQYYKNLAESLEQKLELLETKIKKAKLDSVGEEDDDINNDGKVDSTDDYLMNRRKAIGRKSLKEDLGIGPGGYMDQPENPNNPSLAYEMLPDNKWPLYSNHPGKNTPLSSSDIQKQIDEFKKSKPKLEKSDYDTLKFLRDKLEIAKFKEAQASKDPSKLRNVQQRAQSEFNQNMKLAEKGIGPFKKTVGP